MQKIQIDFPDPLIRRVRELAEREGRSLNEVIRRAVELFAAQSPAPRPGETGGRKFPTFRGGEILTGAEDMKRVLYEGHE